MLSRRSFLTALGAGIGGLAAAPYLRAAEGTSQKPNIILFMVDDMGWQDTSVPFWYGKDGQPIVTRLNERYKTPNMEQMAKDGVLFTQAYACPVCSPTRCSLMSGMNMARHRVTDWTLGVDQNDRLNSNGEGCNPPVWAANGLQPKGTSKQGSCTPPWKRQGDNKTFYQPTLGSETVDYAMTAPYTNALAFPQLLREAGYHTIHCGKAHWGSGSHNTYSGSGMTTPGADPRNFGFDVNIAGSEIGGPANYRGDCKYGNSDTGWVQFGVPGLDENNYYSENVFLTDALTSEVIAELTRHQESNPETPFYLYMAHYVIHAPWENAKAYDSSRSASENVASDTKNPNPNDGLNWNETERNYSVLIKGMDDSLGMLRQFLAEKNIANNTIIIFMADNGGQSVGTQRMSWSNAPLRAGKGSCYEGGIREPMMVVWPGVVTGGTVCHEPVHIDDFYPTILDMAGVTLPTAEELAVTPEGVFDDGARTQVLDGQSIVPLLKGERTTVDENGSPRSFLWHYPNKWGEGPQGSGYNFYTVVRRGDWKLIYNHNNYNNTPTFELYNLAEDISETVNLASRRPDQVEALRVEMARLMRAYGAQMPTRGGVTVPYPDDPSLSPMNGTTLRGTAAAAN